MSEENDEEKSEESKEKEDEQSGVGLDIGTMNLVSSRKEGDEIQTKRMRDAFLELDSDYTQMLKMSEMSYIEYEDRYLILGDPALELANTFKEEVRRPLSQGLISSDEIDALEVLSILIENVVGEPKFEGEVCYYSVPGEPVDIDRDVTYHESVFRRILGDLGYDPHPANEALAIIYGECASDGFSGIGLSFGAGMVNAAMAYHTVPVLDFSVAKGGDWIDEKAAEAVSSTASRMCSLKEDGDIDITDPQDREEEAIAVYYRALINTALDHIVEEFKKSQDDVELSNPIPLVVSGGTSQIGGFLEFFKEVFEERKDSFPIEISEIRQAEDPLTAVSQGLLVQAMQEE